MTIQVSTTNPVAELPPPLILVESDGTQSQIPLTGSIPGDQFSGTLIIDDSVAHGVATFQLPEGGLVDLEYGVQILQVMYGIDVPELRTPRIHEALDALTAVGVITEEETTTLTRAYEFLRHLINGMRMLRGSAKDLFLPPVESDEFAHLARRMGYERGGPLDPAQQLYIDFETHTATVRGFSERYFGRDALPGQRIGTVADLILSEDVSNDLRDRILTQAGFKNPTRALVNLKSLAGEGGRRDTFAKLAAEYAEKNGIDMMQKWTKEGIRQVLNGVAVVDVSISLWDFIWNYFFNNRSEVAFNWTVPKPSPTPTP